MNIVLAILVLCFSEAWPAWTEPKPLTKIIQVVVEPGRNVRECINGVCRERWIPAVTKPHVVRADIDPLDQQKAEQFHYRWSLGTCGMVCGVHGSHQELVDAIGKPAPSGADGTTPVASATGKDDNPASAAAGRGWYLGKRIKERRGR